jgi:CubicO group peptidase (beta-lactamase class C family)
MPVSHETSYMRAQKHACPKTCVPKKLLHRLAHDPTNTKQPGMTKTLSVLFALVCTFAIATEPSTSLPRSNPEAQGVSSAAILDFVKTADRESASLHSFMLIRHGQVVAEGWWTPYNPDSRHELYSLSKSFTSTAVGLAITEGRLSLDDQVSKFFPDDMPAEASSQLKAMRIRDLLTMSTGHTSEPKLGKADVWTKVFLGHPVTHKPGTFFMYNTPATYMLSAIVQKQTGTTTLDFLKPRLFEPLGIAEPTWGTSPQGISLGGYGLSVRTEDIAKFGQLYLQRGKWGDKQLVPADWIDLATARQVSNGSNPSSDWEQGYGFQFWRCRHGNYRGDGAFGQYCIVLPKQDAVIAITSGTKDMGAVLNLVWDRLLPGIQEQPLAPNPTADQELRETLEKLAIPTQAGEATSSMFAGIDQKRFAISTNDRELDAISLERAGDGNFVLVTHSAGSEHRIACGKDAWVSNKAKFGPYLEQNLAACGAWTKDNEYTAKLCLFETPFCLTTRLQFQGGEVLVNIESNVGFGQSKWPELVGSAQ